MEGDRKREQGEQGECTMYIVICARVYNECLNCSGHWEEGLRCPLIRCTLGSGKSEKGWDFGGEGTREQWGTKGK